MRGPLIAMTSSISTSRRVPVNVTPTRGADPPVAPRRRSSDSRRRRRSAPDSRNQPHRVLIEPAEALHRSRRAELAAAQILDVVALHDRRVGVEEEAPVRLVAPEQRFRSRAGVIAEIEEGEPPVADLLPEHADRVVLAEERLERIFRVLADPVHHGELRRRPALPKSRDASNCVRPMPRTSLATVTSYANASRMAASVQISIWS